MGESQQIDIFYQIATEAEREIFLPLFIYAAIPVNKLEI